MIKNKRIIITGGAGFIGSHLAERLVKHNTVTVLDDMRRVSREIKGVDYHAYDVTRIPSSTNAFFDADIIIHCAAIAGIDTVIDRPVNTLNVNVIGTNNVLLDSYLCGLAYRFVLFSTSEVYGTNAIGVNENSPTTIGTAGVARWIYASSKIMCEHMAHAYSSQFGLQVTVIRPFNIFGPHQIGEGAMLEFIKRALKNENINIYGDGSRIRSWCYIDDLVDGVLKAIEAPPDTFNIGNPRATLTIYELAKTVKKVLNSKSKIVFKKDLRDRKSVV